MKLATDIKPLFDLETSLSEIVREMGRQRRTLVITDEGHAKAVLMDVASYDRWRQAMAMLKLIAQSETDHTAGRTYTQAEADEYLAEALAEYEDEDPRDSQ